jgi:hypothetical protein
MFAFLRSPVLAVALLVGPATPAAATTTTTARDTTYVHENRNVNPGDADAGLVWIVVGIAVIVFFVWLCAKIGDSSRPSDGVMG